MVWKFRTTALIFSIRHVSSSFAMSSAASHPSRVIDSHLHIWANTAESSNNKFPYAEGQEPPEQLRDKASMSELLAKMKDANVKGALIVQPINHKFDHSYVLNAMKEHPTKFKGMLLHDPSMSKDQAVSRLEDLALQGFVGVRFNPYLWPKVTSINDAGESLEQLTPMSSTEAGKAVYKRCAELNMPVGVMCFQGLGLHYNDLIALLESSPKTIMILDHFGFTGLDDEGDAAFEQLLELAKKYPQVVVKISALFRLKDSSPNRKRVQVERLEPLLKALGPDRLMVGTDFPFVLEQPESYKGTVSLVKSWLEDDRDRQAVLGGTAERLFGPWV